MAHKVTASTSTGEITVYVNITDQVIIKQQLEKDGFKNVKILDLELNAKRKK